MSGLAGAVVEAWDELRIHKLRVLLALIGVAAAVTAITGVTAAVQMLTQGMQEQVDRSNGRMVSLTLDAWPTTGTVDADQISTLEGAQAVVLERYGITYASRRLWMQTDVRFSDGTLPIQVTAVDPAMGTLSRIVPEQGRWFAGADADAFAPVLVVNEAFLTRLGLSDLSSRPTVQIGMDEGVTATVVGVVSDTWQGASPEAYVLYDQSERWALTDPAYGIQPPGLMMWVPADQADGLREVIPRDLRATLPGWQINVSSNADGGGFGFDRAARWVALGVGGFALLLGGLGLLNISLVTVRHRIREIGIRRSFGATSTRVFFGVMLESVVATVVAGLIGVVLAVAVIKNIPIERIFGTPLQ
ncbi:MAG: FtsX-like permease family protein, partial [Cellulomonadaceae bacterium]|nr:FtsX-like permease family protein [Cellulomonadaceae bacterium]